MKTQFEITIENQILEITGYYNEESDGDYETPSTYPDYEIETITVEGVDVTDLLLNIGGNEFYDRIVCDGIANAENTADGLNDAPDVFKDMNQDFDLYKELGQILNPNN